MSKSPAVASAGPPTRSRIIKVSVPSRQHKGCMWGFVFVSMAAEGLNMFVDSIVAAEWTHFIFVMQHCAEICVLWTTTNWNYSMSSHNILKRLPSVPYSNFHANIHNSCFLTYIPIRISWKLGNISELYINRGVLHEGGLTSWQILHETSTLYSPEYSSHSSLSLYSPLLALIINNSHICLSLLCCHSERETVRDVCQAWHLHRRWEKYSRYLGC